MSQENWIDAKELTLDEWLSFVYHPPKDKLILLGAFPSDKHRDEYIESIQNRSDDEVIKLLHSFLIKSQTFGFIDEIRFQELIDAHNSNHAKYEKMISHSYYRRLFHYFKVSKQIYPWEGNTWVLDLLPHSPKVALEGLNAYIFANIPVLPDIPMQGLFDAAEIIRAKYIGLPGTQRDKVKLLHELSPRQFENLTERLYNSMGYETLLTQSTRDGGLDVTAKIDDGARREFLLIECKRYAGLVDVLIVRGLNGVLKTKIAANRGVVVTSGKFTADAKKFADETSIQLIDGDKFVLLLNEHLGANWAQKLDRIIAESEKHYQETSGRKKAKRKTSK
jgi:restriction system protein